MILEFIIIILLSLVVFIIARYLDKKYKNDNKKRISKAILIFTNPIISIFTTIIFFKMCRYLFANQTNTSSKSSANSFSHIFIYVITAAALISIIALLYFIYSFFIEKLFYKILIGIVTILFIIMLGTLEYPELSLVLSYICSLIINHMILETIINNPNLFTKTTGYSERELDIAKLSFLWTIIIFLLGLFFNIKK
mgnify:CR=1 FL=1